MYKLEGRAPAFPYTGLNTKAFTLGCLPESRRLFAYQAAQPQQPAAIDFFRPSLAPGLNMAALTDLAPDKNTSLSLRTGVLSEKPAFFCLWPGGSAVVRFEKRAD